MLLATIIGNIGKDAETKQINGKDYISFSVASTEKNGEQESTTWISVLTSNNANLLPFLKKGQQVFVQGRLKVGMYQTQQNVGIDISVFASTLQLCGGKKEESADKIQTPAANTRPETTAQQSFVSPFPPAVDESGNAKSDDLPF